MGKKRSKTGTGRCHKAGKASGEPVENVFRGRRISSS